MGPAALAVYQLLGRHLLGLSRAQRALHSAWADMQACKRGVPMLSYKHLTPAHALCRMQSYVLQVRPEAWPIPMLQCPMYALFWFRTGMCLFHVSNSRSPWLLFVNPCMLCIANHISAPQPGMSWMSAWSMQELVRYSTLDVLEPLWADMETAMRKATNIDQVGGMPCIIDAFSK